jgi:hypothetical protein
MKTTVKLVREHRHRLYMLLIIYKVVGYHLIKLPQRQCCIMTQTGSYELHVLDFNCILGVTH